MNDAGKMFRTIINGQSAMKSELLTGINKVDNKVEHLDQKVDKLDKKID